MRYICFDIGDKRTGIAFGDDNTCIANPVGMIEVTKKKPDSGKDCLLDQLCTVINDHNPDIIIVGLPLNMDGTHGSQAKKTVTIAERLAKKTNLPVRLHDERLSTYTADQIMAQSGLTHKQKKNRRDALAAATTLQDFLNNKDTACDIGISK